MERVESPASRVESQRANLLWLWTFTLICKAGCPATGPPLHQRFHQCTAGNLLNISRHIDKHIEVVAKQFHRQFGTDSTDHFVEPHFDWRSLCGSLGRHFPNLLAMTAPWQKQSESFSSCNSRRSSVDSRSTYGQLNTIAIRKLVRAEFTNSSARRPIHCPGTPSKLPLRSNPSISTAAAQNPPRDST